ncbi:MAG: EFR1 family ferrodoxin [Proteobacteria bacterium]|nr:EFR1 family ferrodoxin [Pseudomonadota bacterium]
MKTLIIYFSQTGYTKKAAECIRDGIVSAGGQCELVTLDKVNVKSLAGYDLVGLGCPVFYYQEPFHVRDFIDALPELKGKLWFVFASHASVLGITLNSMTEHLQKKGVTVIGYFDMYADATAPFSPHPTTTTGHPDEIDLERARVFGREIVPRWEKISRGDLGLIPEPQPVDEEWVKSAEMLSRELVKNIMPQLTINKELCTGCGQCEENCPVHGIDISSDPPRIQNPCIHCCFCVEVCPVMAIEGDYEMVASMNPGHYARWKVALDQAAAREEFRWLVDYDQIDFDDYMYKQWKRERK